MMWGKDPTKKGTPPVPSDQASANYESTPFFVGLLYYFLSTLLTSEDSFPKKFSPTFEDEGSWLILSGALPAFSPPIIVDLGKDTRMSPHRWVSEIKLVFEKHIVFVYLWVYAARI